MLIATIVLVILVLVGVIVGAASGLFKIERKGEEEPTLDPVPGDGFDDEDDEFSDDDIDKYDADPFGVDDDDDDDDDWDASGKVDLTDAFSPEQPAAPKEKETEPEQGEEERYVQTDRISDFKTGRSYMIECQVRLGEAKAEGHVYAAVYFDFDRFRFINSLKGFSIGDYVLARMSQELEYAFPTDALLTRISADHFGALFPVSDMEMFELISDNLKMICEKIRGDVGIKSGLRVCMGVALTENTSDYDIAVLMHKANIARHCIKVSRSETYKTFESSMLSTYLYGESALEDYSENQFDEEFVIHYIPQEEVARHRIAGCDTLVCWSCEDDSNKNLPIQLRKTKIPSNASKVVYQVCKSMSRWRKSGKEVLQVSVSIPITELMKEDVDAFLAKCLQEFQIEPAMLCIMIDASIIRVDWSAVSHQMKKIRDIGVKIGVDEIDTGYVNLEFLNGLPVNLIKLHRSFAQGVDKSEERRQKADNMIRLAKGLKLGVIFDGVDSLEQAEALKELGPVWVQGSYCGKIQTSEEFAQGLPAYVERQRYNTTVILDDAALSQGDFKVY